MNSITFGALPFSILESQSVIDVPAAITSLAGWKKPIKFANRTTVPFAFVLEHVDKLIPSGVRDRFGKTVIPDHVSNSQVFNMYRLVIADKFFACLMKKITALIRNFLMLHSKPMYCFTSGIRIFLLPGYRALKSFKPFLSLAEIFRAFHRFAVRSGEECLDTEVNADFIASIFRLRHFNFAEDGGIVSTRSAAGDGNRLHYPLNGSVDFYLNPLRSRDVKSIIQKRPSLGNRKRLRISTFLKPGKFSSTVKEAAVGKIKMPETLLQGLGIYFSEPAILLLLLELGEHSRCIMVVQPLLLVVLMFCIPIKTLAQEIVVDKAGTTKVFLKKDSLCSIGIYSVFVCFINFHITNHTMCFVICQGGIHLPAEAGSFLPNSL